ncbi:MAG: putative selenate ABC transporter substrate-binding protein [Actinobacteria bacterium]|nr:putative selenate ABC transporter substrate-binding protein [Actinomycetota bacterium]
MTRRFPAPVAAVALLLFASCGSSSEAPAGAPGARPGTLTIGAIPDQDPEKLQRLYATVATYLSRELGVPVEYKPVTDYTASVNLFRSGDLDLVWFGGLTGVQARLQVPGARAILQRDIDAAFRSVFIVNTATQLSAVDTVSGLAVLAGRRFTFGSESSTSGRLMPEYFLDRAGVGPDDFAGRPGFSGSHDKTIALVEAGTFEAGALNEQVWKARQEAGQVDPDKVRLLFTTPPYHDYHWVIGPGAARRYGPDFVGRVSRAFSELDPADPTESEILELFGADRFIPTDNDNYRQIEEIGRKRGLIS